MTMLTNDANVSESQQYSQAQYLLFGMMLETAHAVTQSFQETLTPILMTAA